MKTLVPIVFVFLAFVTRGELPPSAYYDTVLSKADLQRMIQEMNGGASDSWQTAKGFSINCKKDFCEVTCGPGPVVQGELPCWLNLTPVHIQHFLSLIEKAKGKSTPVREGIAICDSSSCTLHQSK